MGFWGLLVRCPYGRARRRPRRRPKGMLREGRRLEQFLLSIFFYNTILHRLPDRICIRHEFALRFVESHFDLQFT